MNKTMKNRWLHRCSPFALPRRLQENLIELIQRCQKTQTSRPASLCVSSESCKSSVGHNWPHCAVFRNQLFPALKAGALILALIAQRLLRWHFAAILLCLYFRIGKYRRLRMRSKLCMVMVKSKHLSLRSHTASYLKTVR